MAKYRKISTDTKKEIKKAYEYGVDLIDLSIQYLVNNGTLRNLASKDGWIKGKNKGVLEQAFIEDDITKRVELRDRVIGNYRTLHQSNLSYLMELDKNGIKPKVKSHEEALKLRVQATAELYKLGKELYSIETSDEKIDRHLKHIKYEEGKKTIKDHKGVTFVGEDEED